MKIKTTWAVQLAAALAMIGSAQATLLVYEGFNYTPGTVLTNNPSGGIGFAAGSNWITANNGAGAISVKTNGVVSAVGLANPFQPNPFTNGYKYLITSGHFVGPSDGIPNGGVNAPDHISLWRALETNVTATFVVGSKTYFSFTSARAFTGNARAPSICIGAGILKAGIGFSGDRGDTMYAGPNGSGGIALGANTQNAGQAAGNYPGATLNGVAANVGMVGMYLPQFYNPSGVRTLGPAVGVGAFSTAQGAGPQPGDHAYWMQGGGGVVTSLLYGYSTNAIPVAGTGDNASHVNIIVGEIEWGAGDGGTDLLSYYVFHDNDPLTEAAFKAGKTNWNTLNISENRTNWNFVSIAGGRYFTDEIRIATTFKEVVGQSLELRIIQASYDANQDQLTLKWDSESGATYIIENTQEFGNDLLPIPTTTSWDSLATGIASGGGTTTFQVDAPSPGTYYRIRKE